MKKLIVVLAAIAMGFIAQAAQVNWTMSGITNSPDANKTSGWVAYLVSASKYDTFLTKSGSALVEYVTGNYLYTSTTQSGGKGQYVINSTDGNYSEGDKEIAFLVLFNNADATKATYYANTKTLESGAVGSAGADISLAFGAQSSATSGWTAVSVPEPTSGFLILLGMAGLALRRRRA